MKEAFLDFLLSDSLLWVAISSYIISTFLIFLYRNKTEDKGLTLLFLYLLLAPISDITCAIAMDPYINAFVMNLYALLSGVLLYLFLIRQFPPRGKIAIKFLIVIHVVSCILEFVLVESWSHVSDKSYIIQSVSIVILSLIYLFTVNVGKRALRRDLLFWIMSALLLFFGSTLILWMMRNSVLYPTDFFAYLWSIQVIANILFNTLLIFGIWKVQLRSVRQ